MTIRIPTLLPILACLSVAACGADDGELEPTPEGRGTGGSLSGTGGSLSGTGGATSGGAGGSLSGTGGSLSGTGGATSGGAGGSLSGTGGSTSGGTGGSLSGTGGSTSGGTGGSLSGTGGGTSEEAPVCELPDGSEHVANPSVGGGGAQYVESDHFLIFGANIPDVALDILEAAHQCFVEDWCWRSPGLSVHSDDGPYYKFNAYAVDGLSAGGYMQYDYGAGLAYIEVRPNLIANAAVTVHEYGHALTLTEYGWVDQKNTGFWWESVANFVADSFQTSPYCAAARDAFGVASSGTLIDLDTVIGNSHWTICMNRNYYQAWPFLTYLTTNPDEYPGLGQMAVPDLFRNHLGNNETPLHVLERLIAPITVQSLLGRYWARMAYLDIEHPQAQRAFFDARGRLDFDNLTSVADQTYAPRSGREPRYGGANIIPLEVTGNGDVSVQLTNTGNGRAESDFVATLSIRSNDDSVRYVELPGGTGQATIGSDEEASLVVVNAPDTLYMYDPELIGPEPSADPASLGLNYQVRLVGAIPAG